MSDHFDDPHVIRARRNRKRAANTTDASPAVSQPHRGPLEARFQPVKEEDRLGYFQIGSLTLNRIIGTGIFAGPQVVLAITNSKGVSLVLWLVGGVITWAGLTVYLEYGIRWPLTGGELHYVDYVWTRPKGLFAYLYSVMFVALSGSHGSALVFGSAVFNASTPAGTPVERRLQKLFATLLVAIVCLFQYFSRLNYIRFADAFAIYKLLLCSTVSIFGFIALTGKTFSKPEARTTAYGSVNMSHSFSDATISPYVLAIATLQIMRAYFGYENVNYILEEVREWDEQDRRRVYRRSMKVTVFLVTMFYILMNLAYFAAGTTEEIAKAPDMLTLLFTKVFGPSPKVRTAASVLLCLSAAGNVMAVTYTNTRVRQEIAREGIIPWPEFWSKSTQLGTPGPALLLHWIFSTILIIVAPLDDPNGYLIISTLYNYCRTLLGVMLGVALLAAPWLTIFAATDDDDHVLYWWKPQSSRLGRKHDQSEGSNWGIAIVFPLVVLYIAAELFVFIVSWFPVRLQNGLHTNSKVVTSYAGPTSGVLIYVAGFLYWVWDVYLLPRLGWHFTKLQENTRADGTIVLRYARHYDGFCERVREYFRTMSREADRWRRGSTQPM